MVTRFIDSHLHLQDNRLLDRAGMVIAKAARRGVSKFFCNATRESDWPLIVELASRFTDVIPFLAIHPWHANTASPGWDTRLYETLTSLNHRGGVGETGLDKTRSADFVHQVVLFKAHLKIAASSNSPISIHCVRCWGKLLSILEDHAKQFTLPPTMIHSFNGSRETMQRLVDMNCFISYSSALANPENRVLRKTFRHTPMQALLLETDAPDQLNVQLVDPEELTTVYNEPAVIPGIYRFAAHQRGVNLENLAAQIWQNATIYANKAFAG